jgi:hypothetical protein
MNRAIACDCRRESRGEEAFQRNISRISRISHDRKVCMKAPKSRGMGSFWSISTHRMFDYHDFGIRQRLFTRGHI